jgi:peptide/nickel transport system substrate-binding protein
MNKQNWLSILAIMVLVSGIGICAAEDKSDKTLVVGDLFDITASSLDPAQEGSGLLADKAQIIETLVGVNADMSLKPKLAESWSMIDDRTWEFKLRDNVYFHDGSKMTADSVKFSIERANSLNSRVPSLLKLDSIEVVDPLTIRIHTKEPNYILPADLHYAAPLGIISPKSVNDKGEIDKPIGTGPFSFESYDEKTHVMTVTKNDKWWGGDVLLDKIVIKPITDPNTRALSIENGEVDFTVDVPYSEIERLNGTSGISVDKFENSRLTYMNINLKKEPFDDVRVRKAIAYGMDRQSIVKYVLFGVGTPAVGIFRPDFYWTDKDLKAYDYNVEKAKSLLEEAGWKDSNGDGIVDKNGKNFEMSLITSPNRPSLPLMAEAIAGQLKEVGIKANVEILESGVVSDRQKKGEWDVTMSAVSVAMVPDASYILESFFTSGGTSNKGYKNSEVDQLLEDAAGSKDEEERISMYKEVQSIIQEEVPIIPLTYYQMVVAKKDYVKGYVFDYTSHDYTLTPETYIER